MKYTGLLSDAEIELMSEAEIKDAIKAGVIAEIGIATGSGRLVEADNSQTEVTADFDGGLSNNAEGRILTRDEELIRDIFGERPQDNERPPTRSQLLNRLEILEIKSSLQETRYENLLNELAHMKGQLFRLQQMFGLSDINEPSAPELELPSGERAAMDVESAMEFLRTAEKLGYTRKKVTD